MGNQMTLIEMAKEAGFTEGELAWHDHILERFAALVAEKEREECAKVCDEIHAEYEAKDSFPSYAEAIRARAEND
jgi:hypothetical protein